MYRVLIDDYSWTKEMSRDEAIKYSDDLPMGSVLPRFQKLRLVAPGDKWDWFDIKTSEIYVPAR